MSAPRKSYRKGDPARNFAADDYNAIAAEVERWANLKAIAPLAIGDGPGGRYLTRDGEPSFYAKLTGASSPYAWTEQVETATGVWANGERSGTDAYEVNSRASLNDKVARLYPTAFDHRFKHLRAGTPSGGGTIPISGCQCSTQTPASIIWTSTDAKLPSCTITYQPTPYPSGGYADAYGNIFLGPQMYDSFGAGFRIYMYCYLFYRIGPIYDDYPTPLAYSYMGDYRFFTTAASPNSCSPWSFTKSTNVAMSLPNQTDISMAPGP